MRRRLGHKAPLPLLQLIPGDRVFHFSHLKTVHHNRENGTFVVFNVFDSKRTLNRRSVFKSSVTRITFSPMVAVRRGLYR